MTEQPDDIGFHLWLANVHLWGMLLFGAMFVTSAGAVDHHLLRAGVLPKRRNAVELAEEVLRAVQ